MAAAQSARDSGNEGRARVCARRAAGVATAAYFASQGIASPGASVIDLLTHLQSLSEISEDIRETAGLLLMRVNPDYQLPAPVDLLAETRRLIDTLDQLTPPAV